LAPVGAEDAVLAADRDDFRDSSAIVRVSVSDKY
jgi:hypothetical protein